jgi:hypothetical protein
MSKLKEIIRKKLAEMSATGVGGASFSPGEGMNYATPKAFKKTKNLKEGPGATLGMGPSAGAKGVNDNAYVKQFKYKLVPDKIKGSGLEVKQLWEEDTNSSKGFHQERIEAFDKIENELNDIYKMLSNAKNKTAEYYNSNPGSYGIVYPTDLVLDYIKDIKNILTRE